MGELNLIFKTNIGALKINLTRGDLIAPRLMFKGNSRLSSTPWGLIRMRGEIVVGFINRKQVERLRKQ